MVGRFCCSGCVVGVFTVTLVLSYSANENFNVTHTQTPGRQIRAVITLSPKNTQKHNDAHTHTHTHTHKDYTPHTCSDHAHTCRQTNINGVEVSQANTCKSIMCSTCKISLLLPLHCATVHAARDTCRDTQREREREIQSGSGKEGCTTSSSTKTTVVLSCSSGRFYCRKKVVLVDSTVDRK